jgi:hypothetical protein
VFLGECVILPEPEAAIEVGSIGPVVVVVHVNVDDTILAAGIKFSASPLHVVCERVADVLVRTGTGFTVTTTGTETPGQPFAQGVIVYVTVPFETPSLLLSV